MKRYWQHIVHSTERRVEDFLQRQVRDASRPDCGRMESEMVEGKPTVYLLTDCLCLYFCEQSRWYRCGELFRAVESGVSFLERWQREDGSMDFPSCNFYSAPDTAFCFRRLYGAWEILKKYGRTEEEQSLRERYLRLMVNCAPILLHGGFHTPNHRWAVMSALLVLAELMENEGAQYELSLSGAKYGLSLSDAKSELSLSGEKTEHRFQSDGEKIDPETGGKKTDFETDGKRSDSEIFGKKVKSETDGNKIEYETGEKGIEFGMDAGRGIETASPAMLRARAARYRNEGIDCDEDGEYAERSTGNYNAVVDKCLMQAYEITGDESLAACVERNLTAMLYYIDGDGTVFTENSTRQDQGRRLYPDGYFYLYTWMAEKTGSDIFDAAAHRIIRDNMQRGDLAPDCMYIFMTHERLWRHEFRGCGFPETYRRFFRGSEVLRVQNGKFGYSVRNRQAKFLFLKFRSLCMWVRIGEAYCDIRNFIPDKMNFGDDVNWRETMGSGDLTCTLEAAADGWYYAPFEEKPDTADWWRMDHAKRDRIITSRLTTKVIIRELADGLEITVKTGGLTGLPLRVEIGLPAGCVLEHDAFRLTARAGQSLLLKQGVLRVADGSTRVEIGPGFGTHAFGGHYSGEAGNADGFSVFLNDYTTCKRTFEIRQV